ncbi:hypothetical protein RF11_12657 [Thelohanellus kitauei]|uniref:Uncharacterized protein n=1 Tax=Thelohanellus kitauei TaxID=669202 RepID=A0A0C2IWQ0_THEKT|nr:hypothetical protein RF11_12657 [Thelohanellus kitauei]
MFGLTPFMYATAYKDSLDCMRVLYAYCPECIRDVDKMGNDALHLAVLYDNIEGVAYLLRKGFDMMKMNHYKETALDLAYKNSRYHVAKLLESRKYTIGLSTHIRLLKYLQSHPHKVHIVRSVFTTFTVVCDTFMCFTNVYLNLLILFGLIVLYINFYMFAS